MEKKISKKMINKENMKQKFKNENFKNKGYFSFKQKCLVALFLKN